MSRHLVDPELAVGLDTNMPAYTLDSETLPTYRQMLLDMVAAIAKPTSEAMINVRRDERLVPGPEGSPDVRVLVYSPGDKGDIILPRHVAHSWGRLCQRQRGYERPEQPLLRRRYELCRGLG